VDDSSRLAVLHHRCERVQVADIAADQWTPLHRIGMAVGKVVKHHWLVASLHQRLAGMRANEACASGHEYLLHMVPGVRRLLPRSGSFGR